MQVLFISSLCALFESNIQIVFLISFFENRTFQCYLSFVKWESKGNVLPLSIKDHQFSNKKKSLFLLSQLQIYFRKTRQL